MTLLSVIPRTLVGMVSLALLVPASAGTATAAPTPDRSQAAAAEVGRLVVWDNSFRNGGRGMRVWAAAPDGSDRRSIYRSPRGVADNATVSRDGRFVALGTNAATKPLVVAATDGSGHRDLLRRHPRIRRVGVFGWSPNGRRLAFEGFVGQGRQQSVFLFTIRADGTGLRRHLRLQTDPSASTVSGALGWTSRGIVYPDDRHIWLLQLDGRRRVLVSNSDLGEVRPSGDGRRVFYSVVTSKVTGDSAKLLRMGPTGRDRRLVVARSNRNLGVLFGFTPDLRGERLLTTGPQDDVIGFNVTPPRQVATVPIDAFRALAAR